MQDPSILFSVALKVLYKYCDVVLDCTKITILHRLMATLFPSLISGNLLDLGREIKMLDPYVDGYHLDVMDFHFVPNLTWGPDFINAIRSATPKVLFVHLMVEYPETYFDRMDLSKNDIVAIHYESPSKFSLESIFEQINSYGWTPSIALNPATGVKSLFPLKDSLKNVLLMSVEPGFSGQEFKPHTLQKLAELALWRREQNLSFTIGLDGGINATNCGPLIKLGADQLAIASAIFNHPNYAEAIKNIIKNC
jgi:ribulose-phosphate 3-epimerase